MFVCDCDAVSMSSMSSAERDDLLRARWLRDENGKLHKAASSADLSVLLAIACQGYPASAAGSLFLTVQLFSTDATASPPLDSCTVCLQCRRPECL